MSSMIEFFDDKQAAWRRQIVTSQNRTDDEATAAFRRYIKTHRDIPEPAQHPGRFEVFSTITLAHPSRLYPSACCPDKDLFIVVSRYGNKDRVALWKMQGSKKWEVDVARGSTVSEVVSIAWNPNGRNVMIAHHPPRLTLHSLESGREIHAIPISLRSPSAKLSAIWWRDIPGDEHSSEPFPDIVRRRGHDPGSVHSLLSHLPPLDLGSDDVASSRGAEVLIASSASRRRISGISTTRQMDIEKWPTLLENLQTSQSGANNSGTTGGAEKNLEKKRVPSTMLIAADTLGRVLFFLEGTFQLGSVQLAPVSPSVYWFTTARGAQFLTHFTCSSQSPSPLSPTLISPSIISLPLLKSPECLLIAQTSTTLRQLLHNCRKDVVELRSLWLGTENNEGAAALGPKWLKGIELIQRDNWGYHERRGILELTMLLVTGQASQTLASIFAGGESTSDRKLARWRSSVTEALVKIRDVIEKRLHPALQRAFILVEELGAWANLPGRFAGYNLPIAEIEKTLNQIEAGIYLAAWLAMVAREELIQFSNFAEWLRFETEVIQSATDSHRIMIPKYDPIEVNKYLMSGLLKSEIDSWFEGAAPDERLIELFRGKMSPFSAVVSHATKFLRDTSISLSDQTSNPENIAYRRNLFPLIDTVIKQCSAYFCKAAAAVSEASDCSILPPAWPINEKPETCGLIIKDHIQWEISEPQPHPLKDMFVAYVPPKAGANLLCIFHLIYEAEPTGQPMTRVLVSMNACVPKYMDAERHQYKILDFSILDAENLVIVFRHTSRHPEGSRPFLALAPCRDGGLTFHHLRIEEDITASTTREEVISLAIRLVKETQLSLKPLPLTRVQELSMLSKTGLVSLSCNGKRKVVCVLDDNGVVESIDLSTEQQDFDFEASSTEEAEDEGQSAGTENDRGG